MYAVLYWRVSNPIVRLRSRLYGIAKKQEELKLQDSDGGTEGQAL